MSGPSNPPIPGASFPGGDSVPFSSAVDAKKDKPDDTVPGSSTAGETGDWQIKKKKRGNRGKPNEKQSDGVIWERVASPGEARRVAGHPQYLTKSTSRESWQSSALAVDPQSTTLANARWPTPRGKPRRAIRRGSGKSPPPAR